VIYRDQLEKVYALIEKPENWCQKHYALDDQDSHQGIFPDSSTACRWCLDGALQRASPEVDYEEWKSALGHYNPIAFNDSHTHAEVLALLQSAIERAPVRP
jgi:hypothetical protein